MAFIAVAAWAPYAIASPADPNGYRLAGTLAVGKDYVGFLAVPGGGQVLVRKGSVVDGVRVLDVTDKSIRLALPSGNVELTLDGTVHPVSGASSAAVVSATDDARNRVYNREVSNEQVQRELASASAAAKAPAGTSGGSVVAAQRVAEVLDLPAGSAVVNVQGRPVKSAEAAIKQLQAAFATNVPVVFLDVQTPKGPGRVYLQREQH